MMRNTDIEDFNKLVEVYDSLLLKQGKTQIVRDLAFVAHALTDKIRKDTENLEKGLEPLCDTMNKPISECGCPDCGSSLIDFPED